MIQKKKTFNDPVERNYCLSEDQDDYIIIVVCLEFIDFQSICNLEIGSYLYVCSICYFLMLVQTWQNTNVSSELTTNTKMICLPILECILSLSSSFDFVSDF